MKSNDYWAVAASALAIVILTPIISSVLALVAMSQTYNVLYTFTRGDDGGYPEIRGGSLIFDAAGNLYGTDVRGGHSGNGQGAVYKLTKGPDGTWTATSLHVFCLGGDPCADGAYPVAALNFGADGSLYGTTALGGVGPCYGDGLHGCGVVFRLTPNPDGSWFYSVLHKFKGGTDGAYSLAPLISDASGTLYGTTEGGGGKGCPDITGCGVVFKLSPNPDGTWSKAVLHRFSGGWGGARPQAGLIFDGSGNLFGTTMIGGDAKCGDGAGCGVVFKLTPNPDGSWTKRVIWSFAGRPAEYPHAGLIWDASGSLYGTTLGDFTSNYGTVFKLTPNPDGTWTKSNLRAFHGSDGISPWAGVIFDAAGHLYGTTTAGGLKNCNNWAGPSCGVVYELIPQPDGKWVNRVLYRFTGGYDGYLPMSGLTLDAAGNLYGAADAGGVYGVGVVFEIKP